DLPRDAAMRLAGKLAHPLNRPVMDRQTGLVVEGYSIIQPRVAVSLANANQSPFVRLFGGDPGLDPYTRAVSDVYQDLFLEGSFIGKGIYDLEAFETVLAERLPENRILSHDLLEGSYARAAMASDVLLYENFPSRYLADVSRRHRWIRGDWQIARWLMPRVPGPGGKTLANPLCALSKWKILDNLRRSLVQPGLALLLALGWTVLAPAWVWTALAAGMVLTAPLVTALGSLFRRHGDIPLYLHLKDKALDFGRGLILALLALVLLPFEAFFSLDAVIRTVARLAVTRKKLLQWTPASVALRRAKANIAGYCRAMWFCPASAAGVGAALVLVRPGALYAALPLLGLWTLAPAVAWRLSVTAPPHRAKLNRDQRVFLRKLTRRTWRYFEMIVGPLDNWLPPDNYQEDPVDVIAYRTSPTNMGLSLLSNLAANDFGYIPVSVLMERTSKAFLTMNKLERFKGHFYNWYDTRSLRPLLPQYISTVDSGNLAGFLLTLAMGFEELQDMGLVPRLMHKGLADTLMVLLEVARGQGPAAPAEDKPSLPEETLELIADALGDLAAAPDGVLASISLVREMDGLAGRIIETLGRRPDQEVLWWARAFKKQCADHLKDLTMLAPWTDLPRPPHGAGGQGADPIQGLGGLLKGLEDLDKAASLRDAAGQAEELSILAEDLLGLLGAGEDQVKTWVEQFKNGLEQGGQRLAARVKDLADLSRESQEMANMDWRFLYDKSRNLMAIGYNVDERRADANFYDLLASEARLASFVAIALGDLPQKHWFALGRLLTDIGGKPLLLSWSGSMFEFLMPLLVMPSYEQTLLDRTYKAAVQRQIEYGRQRGVPWGVSESGYNITDANLIFQYRAFGVPGLGFKRGLAEDLVIAPYATVLSLMVLPEKACENLQRMAREGFMGRFGFYEAVDYTPSRVLRGQNRAVVRSFMVHHQGMSFLSLAYLLLNRPMQRRFLRDPLFQATDLLLQERMPKATPFHPHAAEVTGVQRAAAEGEALLRVFTDPNTPLPQVHLLSNGRYHVMVTNSGGGYSRWKDLAVTRWREDATRDNYGTFCYLRDPESGEFWSTGHHPTHKKAENYRAVFSQARAEFRRIDHELDTHTEITVSPEDDIELRRITITNRSTRRRTVELTSYAEVVLARPADEAAHPAFSNLFVQTEIVRQKQAILCTRRRRSHQEDPPWLLHLMAVHGEAADEASYETDRLKFIGRCGSLASPAAMNAAGRLSDSEGAVLDPVVAIRRSILIEPEETRVVHLVTGMTDTRQKAMELMLKHRDRVLANRVFDLAWTHRQVVLRQINATSLDAQTFGRLASSVIYANPLRRAAASVIMKNRQGQSGLWAYGISGDLPIVILRIGSLTNLDIARQVIQAHQYWRHTGLAVDL
ncbi:MAG: glucoamylase family protein, partial [Desulfovibrionaceae bacterium]|nr:glucoamylase family protein [Desulfovibrionaceae bacterium]